MLESTRVQLARNRVTEKIMAKKDLIAAVADETGVTREVAERAISAAFGAVLAGCLAGERGQRSRVRRV